MRIQNILTHSFVPALLRDARVAFDCGANTGQFTRWLSQNSPAQVHGFEPDPRLFSRLPVLPRVEFHPLAIDGESGELELGLGEARCSSALYSEGANQTTVKVKKTSLDDFCRDRRIDAIDLIKIDIEGAELSVLERTSETLLRHCGQITVEFHDFIRKADTPRIVGIFERLSDLSFHCVRFSHFTWGDCLFINQARHPVSLLDRVSIQLSGKLIPGVVRFVTSRVKRA